MNENTKDLKRELIYIASRLVKCDYISELDEICENQKTISCAKLEMHLDLISEMLKKDAIRISDISNKIK